MSLLIRAAQLLEGFAVDIKQSHTVPGREWWEIDSKAKYDELVRVALALREKEKNDMAFANSLGEALNSGDGSYRP